MTPSHIELLKDDAALIPQIVSQAFHGHGVGQQFHVMAAVVDRVTHSRSDRSEPYMFAKVRKKDGAEGISVCILDSETAAPDLWTSRNQPRAKETMSVQQRSTISFLLQPTPKSMEAQINQIPPQPITSRLVQLPVANTVFCNGKTSTILAQRWVVTSTQESGSPLRLTEEIALPQQSLQMDGVVDDQSLQTGYMFSVLLTPITPPRIVAGATGNIIRTVQMGTSPEDSVPASTELEMAVARESRTLKFRGEMVGVWALVTPRENRISRPYARPARIHQNAIDSGSRLHKVLSGGGGWGNKQGLLALDPDSEYSVDSEPSRELFGNGEDLEAEKLEALGQVVKPGDVVSFWAHFAEYVEEKSAPSGRQPGNSKVTALPSLVFGTVPSTMDVLPGSKAIDAEGAAGSFYALIMNHFGMFSEQGMSVKVSTVGPQDRSTLGAEQVGVVVQTKLDTPYSRISIMGKGHKKVQFVEDWKSRSLYKGKTGETTTAEKPKLSQQIKQETSHVPIEDSLIKYERRSIPPRSFRKVNIDYRDEIWK